MSSKNITRAELKEAVCRKVGLSQAESADMIGLVLREICDTLVAGETVKLSTFGSFVVRHKAERMGRNPKTGVEIPIHPRRVVMFKPSPVLTARINGDASDGDL
ncbi:integration host factor subunit alpha [Microvirga aerophila]|uniref:Integration host factor subunit alpha n=1 Tax=Microvirga aerophila TaxID=670291 RepID=A0A512C1Y5_9HYPH|nr:integration host factor subunit alpha [Microvirga aerophila]GEO18203.1 integration host factor subunit alpha [Microvirga aerophila]